MESVNNNGNSNPDVPGKHPPSSLLNKFSTIFVREKTEEEEETAVLTSFRPLSEDESHVRPLSFSVFDSNHDRLKESGGVHSLPCVNGLLLNPAETQKPVETWETESCWKETSEEPIPIKPPERAPSTPSGELADHELVQVTMVEVYSDNEPEDEVTSGPLSQSTELSGVQEPRLPPSVTADVVNDKSDQEQETDSRCDDVIESNSNSERPVRRAAESLVERSLKDSSVLNRVRSKGTAESAARELFPLSRSSHRRSLERTEDVLQRAEETEDVSAEDMGSEVSAARARRRRQDASKLSEANERREPEQPEASEGDPQLILSATSAKVSLYNRHKASSAVPAGSDATSSGTTGNQVFEASEKESEGRDGREQGLPGTNSTPGPPDSAVGQSDSTSTGDTKGLSEAPATPGAEAGGLSGSDNVPSATSPASERRQQQDSPLNDQPATSPSSSSSSTPASRSASLCPFSSGDKSFQLPALFSGLRVLKKGAVGDERETLAEIRQRDGDRALLSLKQHVNKTKLFPEQLASHTTAAASAAVTRRRSDPKDTQESTGQLKEQLSQLLSLEGAPEGGDHEGGSDAQPQDPDAEGGPEEGAGGEGSGGRRK